MRRFTVPDEETSIAAIQDQASRAPEGGYFHQLHVVLHTLQGASSYEGAGVYGSSPESV